MAAEAATHASQLSWHRERRKLLQRRHFSCITQGANRWVAWVAATAAMTIFNVVLSAKTIRLGFDIF